MVIPSRLLTSLTVVLLFAFSGDVCGVAAMEKCACLDIDKGDQPESSIGKPGTNTMCPVMTDQPAEDGWTTVYKGKVVRFCCNNCVESFRKDPEKYLSELPQFANASDSTEEDDRAPAIDPVRLRFLILLISSFAVCTVAWSFHQKRYDLGGRTLIKPLVVKLLFALGITTIVHLLFTNSQLELELFKQMATAEIHHATYFDYGVPPVPNRPEVRPRLARTFYRGNDERSHALYNGGNYQTAQFNLEVQFADGRAVRIGDSLNDETLYLEFTIHKAKHAPVRIYDRSIMDKIYLTREYEPLMGWEKPVADKTPVKTIEEGEVWRCRFPLDIRRSTNQVAFNPKTVTRQALAKINGINEEVADWFVSYRDAGYPVIGPEDLRQAGITGEPATIISGSLEQAQHDGLIYVCEAYFHHERQMGARIHYGLKYDLKIQQGVISEGSEIWMGALSRSLKAARGAMPDNEWLSSEPLPELPAPQQISDELLGIDDYGFQ